MLRRIVNWVPVVSAILCVLSLAAWGFSIGRFEHWSLRREEVPGATPHAYRNSITFWMYSGSGFLQFGVDSWQYNRGPGRATHWTFLRTHNQGLNARSAWTLSGYWRGSPFGPAWRWSTEFSYAFLVVMFAIPPVVAWLIRNRKQRLRGKNMCEQCGYDLRATPQRCPECGAVVEKSEIRNQKSEGNPKGEIPN